MAYSIVDFGKAAWDAAGELGDLFSYKGYSEFSKGRNDLPSAPCICDNFGSFNNWKETYGLKALKSGPQNDRGDLYINTNGDGYEYIHAKDQFGTHHFRIHRLHATLLPEVDSLEDLKDMDVHHKNEVTWHNTEENLEVLTRADHRAIHAETDEVSNETAD